MGSDLETIGDELARCRARQVRARRCAGMVLLPVWVFVGAVSGCSSDSPPKQTSRTSESNATTGPATGTTPTAPAVPPATKDCGTGNALSGWPTTTAAPPNGYACILDAFAAGTPAQMSEITGGSSDSGRKTRDGYDIPTRRIVTWLVLGKNKVRVTTDLTEDGGTATTQTCTGLVASGYASPPEGTGCS